MLETIDWKKQWELFCPYFGTEDASVPLEDFGGRGSLILLPGEGFGDLSHATTYLMLKLTCKYAAKKTLIDLGCGSGILGLAALLSGGEKVYSLDIEEEALKHTRCNAEKNGLSNKVFTRKVLSKKVCADLLLLNMTFFEQKTALTHLPVCPDLWITSGILKEQEKEYLEFLLQFPLTLASSYEKDGWMAFVLKKRPLK